VCGIGYGRLSVNSKRVLAHRLNYEYTHGSVPNGLCVLHICDNPRCVRVEHLFLGTRADNNKDRTTKGRTVAPKLYGDLNHNTKLRDEEVSILRACYVASGSRHGIQRKLAAVFDISYQTVNGILKRGERVSK
jgi:hypothetical protein